MNSGITGQATVVGAAGVHFELADGRRVIDASNTAGSLGHRHPDMSAAIRRAAEAPVVNEGWHWPERERAARDLVEVAFGEDLDWVGAVRFCLSGSEANDLALSLSQALTGRTALATRERAYHGMVGLARDTTVQPHWHGGLSSRHGGVRSVPRTVPVRQLPAPQESRFGGVTDPVPASRLLGDAPLRLRDTAAVIVDYTQGGVYHSVDYQDTLARAAREASCLWIADEVVTAFGRTGGWFAYRRGSSRPDIVTLGKLLGAGAAPAGAVVVSKDLAREMRDSAWQTYSTFRGNALTVAAVQAHLAILQRGDLLQRALELDGLIQRRLSEMGAQHPSVARIGGLGLHWTVELHGPDWHDWRADVPEEPLATRVASRAADAGALIGTSGEQTSLFLAPPLIIEEQDLHRLLDALDHGLELADRTVDATAGAPA